MDIFKLTTESNKVFPITVEIYEHYTDKREPYYYKDKKEMKYFAVCPGCNNPSKLVNLYIDKTLDKSLKKQNTHARHYKHNVKGLANYSQEAYDNCPLSNPDSFSTCDKRKDKEKNNELLKLIKLYPDIIYDFVREITGINFSYKKFNEMLDNFMKTEGYYYKYINKFNLPYGFFYMQKSIGLYMQYVFIDSHYAQEIIDSIRKSKYFVVNNENQIIPSTTDYVEIECYLTKHRIKNKSEETIELRIMESKENKKNLVYKKEMPVNKVDFINAITDAAVKEIESANEKYKRSTLQKVVNKYVKR
ncbi:hypothetical protein D0U04_07135 [Bacillus clarus]|uniref:Uncharacterized protein n=1 Tax=Bacillus clarus TaxID=2338372 RepID=A0A090YT88_9BACI|nr:hypothetical protein [Bacillus clarus]KFN01173.1 hypothetical protein DJ93_4769 [Bacillus clarus]RFT67551.1 hypothetical protein D0U04_07135 [Bacillus clarus]